jgi:antitoxin CptB
MNEDLETTRKKLLYRATYRGTRELDLLVGGFAKTRVAGFTADECEEFRVILEFPEISLSAWLTGQEAVPQEIKTPLMLELLGYRPLASL